MTILVTGAAGFIGRALCRALVAEGKEVLAIIHRQAPIAGVTPIAADLAAPLDRSLMPAPLDTIIHLAQSPRFREFADGARDMFEINLRSTFELLEFARESGARHFIYASSGGIYGEGVRDFLDFEPVVMRKPLGFYLSTKLAAEILVENYADLFTITTLRIFFAYGPGQQPDRLIPRLLENVRLGRPITLEGEQGLAINPIFVDDVVEILLRAIAHPTTMKVNVAGTEVLSLRDIGNILGVLVDRTPVYVSNPMGQSPRLVGDISALITKLGYRPRMDFRDGARRLGDATQ